MQTYGPSVPAPPTTDIQAYRNFIDACRSPHTRYQYHKAIEYFMSYLRIPQHEYSKLLEPDPRITIKMSAASVLPEQEMTDLINALIDNNQIKDILTKSIAVRSIDKT